MNPVAAWMDAVVPKGEFVTKKLASVYDQHALWMTSVPQTSFVQLTSALRVADLVTVLIPSQARPWLRTREGIAPIQPIFVTRATSVASLIRLVSMMKPVC